MSEDQNKKATTSIRSKWAEWIFVNLPYVCFLTLLAVIYIYNAHTSERSLREIDALQKEVKDYRWQYMDLKNELIYGSTQSQLAEDLKGLGIKKMGKVPIRLNGAESEHE